MAATEPFDYDAELRRQNDRLRAAASVGRRDHVLDVGCGTGQTTRDAARAAVNGRAVGIDVAAPMLERARQLSDEEALTNVDFLHANAQDHAFEPSSFDIAISRFGTMFFDDPVAAFTNIGRALRPAGRLVLLVWQGREHNEWSMLGDTGADPGVAPTGRPDPFSLADPDVTAPILSAAGFDDVHFSDVHEPVYYGPDGATAYDAVLGLWGLDARLAALEPAAALQARAHLRSVLDAHTTGDGVYFDSRAWIVTAARRP